MNIDSTDGLSPISNNSGSCGNQQPSGSRSPDREATYRTVLVHGLPSLVKKYHVYSFADTLSNNFGHARFPEVEINFNGRVGYSNGNPVRSAKLVFETERDADKFWRFPHPSRFPGHTLLLERYDANEDYIASTYVEPQETNKNKPVDPIVVLFRKLPNDITPEDIIDLIGKDFIRWDENGYFVKIFFGKRWASAKVVMWNAEDARDMVQIYNGEIFHPFDCPIHVSLN